MKKVLLTIAAISVFASSTVAQDDVPWFDMQNCAVCKNMGPMMDSMHLIHWDPHTISNGMLAITVVPKNLKERWKKAHDGMIATIAKLEQGAEMHCCGMCQSFGKLHAAGAKKQDIKTVGGDIMLFTSTDPKVVAMIHEHVKKTEVEHAKMEKMMSHSHGNDDKGSDSKGSESKGSSPKN